MQSRNCTGSQLISPAIIPEQEDIHCHQREEVKQHDSSVMWHEQELFCAFNKRGKESSPIMPPHAHTHVTEAVLSITAASRTHPPAHLSSMNSCKRTPSRSEINTQPLYSTSNYRADMCGKHSSPNKNVKPVSLYTRKCPQCKYIFEWQHISTCVKGMKIIILSWR